MKTHEEMQSMDDLVFENRNKEYGAYAIRKHYSENLNRAVVFVLGSATLIVAIPLIFSAQKIIPDIGVKPDKLISITSPPPIVLEQIKETIKTNVQKAVRKLAPVVTTAPETTAPVDDIVESVAGSDDGIEGGEAISAGTSEIGVEAVTTPVVEAPPSVVTHSEIMPSFKGGAEAMMRFLSSKVKYPAIARRTDVQGLVFISFIIGRDGNVLDAKVVKGISKECDAEALRVISMMPTWNPGMQSGNPVMVRMVLPIKFQLNH